VFVKLALHPFFILKRKENASLENPNFGLPMAQRDGVESDLADHNPSIYAGRRTVVRIKHPPPL
jgi:hypothetical protein